jgi:hypothetical protein
MTQLERLTKPFPPSAVAKNPTGYGSYVKHSIVNEKLLAVLGGFEFTLVEVIRGADKKCDGPVVVGVVARLAADVDGRRVVVDEAGDCELPSNWPHDGARLKDAMSDAFKRCAMRFGVGLHLWSGDQFTLHKQLVERENPAKTIREDLSKRADLA